MPDVGEITGNAMQLMRKNGKSPAEQLKSPAGMAAVGAAMMALPYAVEGVAKLAGGVGKKAKGTDIGKRAKESAGKQAKKVVGEVADEKMKPSLPNPFGGLFHGGDQSENGSENGAESTEAHGSGRRMPIQQSVDVAVPIRDTYNFWTRFEDWPSFMHRVDSAQQLEDSKVAFSTKVWGVTKHFEAQINEQRPDERIEWDVEQGLTHSGVVTFHELAPRLTRIEVTLDVKPDSLLEKAGRGMRFTKRAVRGDLHRFKAFAEMEEECRKGWRGTIDDGEVKRRTERKPKRSKSSSRSKSRSRSSNGSGSGSSKGRSRSHR
jgi:uncharacterized membrane protein